MLDIQDLDKDYGVSVMVVRDAEMPFKVIKDRLVHQMMREIIPPMIDSGKYHVVKFDIAKRERYEWLCDEYVLIAHLSIAQQQKVYYPKYVPQLVEFGRQYYERVCLFCGNKLMFDKRGGCNACGAPNGGYKS